MYNCDCMELLESGKRWDLAIVDPPYGIGDKLLKGGKNGTVKFHEKYELNKWDNAPPSKPYFDSVMRVSSNQIIWGANYYLQFLQPSRGIISWDKNLGQPYNFSHFELAWTSYDCIARKVIIGSNTGNRIHPTQKPVQLYKWLLTNYAKEGDTILDTHGGSMSIAIACWDLGFDLDICELDTDYFNGGVKRFENHISQTQLF